jgi:hypothetical protein
MWNEFHDGGGMENELQNLINQINTLGKSLHLKGKVVNVFALKDKYSENEMATYGYLNTVYKLDLYDTPEHEYLTPVIKAILKDRDEKENKDVLSRVLTIYYDMLKTI